MNALSHILPEKTILNEYKGWATPITPRERKKEHLKAWNPDISRNPVESQWTDEWYASEEKKLQININF